MSARGRGVAGEAGAGLSAEADVAALPKADRRNNAVRAILRARRWTTLRPLAETIAALASAARDVPAFQLNYIWARAGGVTQLRAGAKGGRSTPLRETLATHHERLSGFARSIEAAKGRGPVISYATTRNGGWADEDCESVTAFYGDCDECGEPDQLLRVLDAVGIAYLFQQSGGWKPGKAKWHITLPFAEAIRPDWLDDEGLAAWKLGWRERYGWIAGVLSELGGLDLRPEQGGARLGLDASTSRLVQPCFIGVRRPGSPVGWTPETLVHEGRLLDFQAALVGTGFSPEPPMQGRRPRGRVAASVRKAAPGSPPSTTATVESALIEAFRIDGRIVRQIDPEKWAVTCPFESEHTTGGGDSSTIIFASTSHLHCSHAHCVARSQRDFIEALSEEARDVYDTLKGQAGVTRLRESLQRHADELAAGGRASVTLQEAAEEIQSAVLDSREGLRVISPGTGVGKTTASGDAVDKWIAARPFDHHRAFVFVPSHKVADEVEHGLRSRQLTVERHWGVTSRFTGNDRKEGRPLCKFWDIAVALERAGASVPMVMCRSCEYAATCKARTPDGLGGRVVLATHAMMSKLLAADSKTDDGKQAGERLVIVDETPELTGQVGLTGRDLQALVQFVGTSEHADDVVADWYARLMRPLVEILALAAERGGDVAMAAREYGASSTDANALQAGWTTLLRAYGKENAASSGEAVGWIWPDAPERVDRPPLPMRSGDPHVDAVAMAEAASYWDTPPLKVFGRDQRRKLFTLRGDRLDVTEFAVRAFSVVRAYARAPELARWDDRGGLYLTRRTPESVVIESEPTISILDAEPPIEELRAIRPHFEIVAPIVEEEVASKRIILYRHAAHRRALAPNREPDWDAYRVMLERALARVRALGARRLLVVTFKVVVERLKRRDAPTAVVAVLDGWAADGREVDLQWFHALRSQNAWVDYDACVSMGDPWPDIGAKAERAAVLGLDDADSDSALVRSVEGELEQVHGRLRDVRRTTPAVHLHVGRVAPARWTDINASIERAAWGRPRKARAVEWVRELVEGAGGAKAVATQLGCDASCVRQWLAGSRPVTTRGLETMVEMGAVRGLEALVRLGLSG